MKSLFSFVNDGNADNAKSENHKSSYKDAKTQVDSIALEELETKCHDLEDSLQLMGKEFEKMEDYWQVSFLFI